MSQCSVLSSSNLILVYLILLALVMVLEVQYTLDAKLPLDILPRGNRNRRRMLKSVERETKTRTQVGPTNFGAGVTVGPEAVSQNDSEFNREFIDYSPRVNYYDVLGSTEVPRVGISRKSDFGASSSGSQGDPPLREASPMPPSKPQKNIKVSPEANAFDDLVDLLTASKTHCLVDEAKGRRGKHSYRCSVQTQRDCRQRLLKGKQYSRKCNSGKRDRRKYKPSYEVNPLSYKWDGNTAFTSNTIRGSWDEGEAGGAVKYSITVDADYTFMEEIKKLKFSPLITFDTKFDLAGLNSLHKYEVVWKLLQVFRWLLPRNGYLLVRSSADRYDLLQYLQQEGLQEPLHILTLWKLQERVKVRNK
ncbi:uncharacterized protein LOC134774228 [Penaeus indicus]|uniref:uncharacterized protein LOC134774228 n=1 Tax=Penaeus indicus TaxID=29960 RepID=UPI00300BFC53